MSLFETIFIGGSKIDKVTSNIVSGLRDIHVIPIVYWAIV